VPSKFTFDHPNSFGRKFGVKGEDRWEDAKKDIEKEREMLNSISSFLSVREKYNIFNRVFSTLIEMLQQIRKLIRVDENLYMQSIPMVNN
jgi:CO dehydrogenase/acetyl-CoA synthase beta subunit